MASTSNLKPMAQLALRLAALAQFAFFAAAACSSNSPTPQGTACGNVAQCPANQACYMNVCTPIQNGSAGNSPVGSAGNSPVGSAGNGSVGSAGGAGVSGIPGGGSGNVPGAGGASAGTGPTGSAGSAGAPPSNTTAGAGYWTSKDWHGCSWTGVGTVGTSTVTPKDFTTKAATDPYCVSGTVGANNSSVALVGFNVNEPTSASCVAKPADTTNPGPPSVVPTANGIAVNFVKKGTNTSFTFRVQIQGPNGAMPDPVGAADRWCATITEVSGKVFVPWSAFTPSCWETTAAKQGTPYAAASSAPTKPISAVVFTVPGTMAAETPYNVCVNGVAYGTTAADAPDGTAVQGDLTGTIGGGTGSDTAPDFQRVKVKADGHDYIIQNNNWGGDPTTTSQTLSYKNNSFKITSTTGNGSDAPASFPSIYIGNNGNTQNGVFSTKGNDNLPIQISAITSITSTFRYSPAVSGAINATYDIWFANSIPTTTYNDGIDGFVMIWLHDPSGKQPIGTQQGTTTVNVAGMPWKVFKGQRGAGPMGSTSNATVISFVNPNEEDNSLSQSFKDINIKEFITKAVSDYGLPANAYLTDVFAGFEIWNGSSSSNLSVDEFKCVVNK